MSIDFYNEHQDIFFFLLFIPLKEKIFEPTHKKKINLYSHISDDI